MLRQTRRQLIVANNVAESVNRPAFAPPGADAPETPRAMLQSRIGEQLYKFMQRPYPPKLEGIRDKGPLGALQSGFLLGSATATGKTATFGTLAERAGVGKPFADVDPSPNRLLVVVPSVDLLREYMSPDGTLALWLPGRTFSAFYHRKKEVGGDVQIIVDESVPDAIGSGAIDLADFPIRVLDEGHHAAAPRMLRELGRLSAGRLVLCTATPQRMRRFFVDYAASTPRSAAEEGITRPVRILTYLYGPEPHAAEKLAARIAAPLIATGRQVGIYCRPLRDKPNAQQARNIATLINNAGGTLPEGLEGGDDLVRPIVKAVGDKENERAEADYRAGKLRGFTAIGMLGEGVNVPMDAAIIIGPRFAQDAWDQIAGRLPRPLMGRDDLKQKPGILIDLQPREVPRGKGPLASSWRTYGFEDADIIEQGILVGGNGEGTASLVRQDEIDEILNGVSQRTAANPAPSTPKRRPSILDELGPELEKYLAPPVPLRELLIAQADWDPPEGSKTLSQLAAKYNVPEMWLRRKLDELSRREDLTIRVEREGGTEEVSVQITYVGVRDTNTADQAKRWEFERWYGPDTEKYLDQNKPTPMAEAELMDIGDIAEMCGVRRYYIETIIGRLEAADVPMPSVLRLGKTNRDTKHFRMPEIAKIIEEVEKTPVASATEEALADIAQETSDSHVYSFVRAKKNNVTVRDRRRRLGEKIAGHVSGEDAARIRNAYFNPPLATEEDISIIDMARMANVLLNTMIERIEKIPEERRPDVYGRKLGPKGRYADHMNRACGLEIVDMVRPHKLPPDRVTLGLLTAYFTSDRKTLTVRINTLTKHGLLTPEEGTAVPINLGGQGGEASTWSWEVMRVLEEHGSKGRGNTRRRPDVEPVDYERLARGPYDLNWEYSQEVQRRFIKPEVLLHLPSHDKLRQVSPQYKLGAGDIELGAYAESRKVRMQDVLEAVADDIVPGVRLYYYDTYRAGHPAYIIGGGSVPALDRHFNSIKTGGEQNWKTLPEALAYLKCSPAALVRLVDANQDRGQGMRVTQERGRELHLNLLDRIKTYAQRRCKPAREEWTFHGRLAQAIGMRDDELVAFMDKCHISVSHDERSPDVLVVRKYSGSIEYDVAYSPRVTRLVLHAKANMP